MDQKVLQLERRLQTNTLNFFDALFENVTRKKPTFGNIIQARQDALQASLPQPQQPPIILSPIEVNGFYKVTGTQEVTFYATTQVPDSPPGKGWSAVGITGIIGQIQLTGYSSNSGAIQTGPVNSESFLWSFTLQTDTDQTIEGVQSATGAILYPPGQIQFVSQKTSAPLYGRYQNEGGEFLFYFSVPPPQGTGPGWIVENLPMIKTALRVTSYTPGVTSLQPDYYEGGALPVTTTATIATLETVDGSPLPVIDVPVYVQGLPAVIHEAYYTTTFVPGHFNVFTYDAKVTVTVNPNIQTGNNVPLRDLNTDLSCDPPPVQLYEEAKDKGLSQGSVLALHAIGPQENYLLSNDFAGTQFSSLFKQYTNFVMYQRVIPFPPPNPSYQGNTLQIELRPPELGHLLSNMYLHVKLPALKGYTMSEHIGRALIKQIDLLVNETIIETLYDDWYIIRDQLFLDADEQKGVFSAVDVQSNISAPIIGTGGNSVTTLNSNTIHTFTSSGTFTLNTASQVNLLVVGGGGAGALGSYVQTLTSNIAKVVAVPSSFTVNVNNTIGAYQGANVSIVSTDFSFSPVVYVQSYTSTSLTLATYGGTAWTSNLRPANTTLTIFNGNGGGGGSVLYQSVFLTPGTYQVTVGSGGTPNNPNGTASSLGVYSANGGYGGGYGGSGQGASYQYFSNIVYESGGGAGGVYRANVTTGTGSSAFTTTGTLGSGGNGYSYSNTIILSSTYIGGGGGAAANTSIVGTLATPGGLGGGGSGAVTTLAGQTIAATSGTVNTGGGGGGTFSGTAGSGGSGVVVLWYSSTANVIPSSDIVIPLEFFFCRRHSVNNKGRERLRRPYFPLCAMWNQKLYVRFTFHPNSWWCNVPVGSQIDIYDQSTTVLPTLITEEILLTDEERLYYMNTPLKYLVPRVKKESTLTFSGNNPQLELTANFPVQTIAWFFRNKNYETVSDSRYADSRYSYGYTTQYIATGIQLQFPSGNSNFVDVISSAKITLNNVDILSTFQGSLYYSFKQPIEHGLSIPSKNIYTYSFGLTPKEYNQGGYLNFSKLNSQTTYLSLTFKPQYTSQLTQGYNLYLFYYGYNLLQFQGGFATTPFQ